MKKRFAVVLILIMMLMATVQAFAEGDIYATLDVEAYGTVKIENTTIDGKGYSDPSLDGTYKINGNREFSFDHLTVPGSYYYNVTEVPPVPPAEGVQYDDSVYTVWVTVALDEETEEIIRSVVLQKNDADDPENPDTASKPENVCFVNKKEETITITRKITYTEYTPDGKEVSVTKEQTANLKRTVKVDEDGNVLQDEYGRDIVFDADGNEITYDSSGKPSSNIWTLVEGESDTSAVTSPTKTDWTADRKIVPEWEIDLNNPEDVTIHVVYTPDEKNIEKEETTTITRTITYTEYTPEGKEVSKTVTQQVTLKRTVTYDPTGTKVLNVGPWEIASDESEYGAVDSPDKTGWTANIDTVGIWNIDLDDPKDEIIHVVYTPNSEPPVDTVTVKEFKTITRTITFTEYTPDGKEVYRTVTQTVTLVRIRTEDKNGNVISYGPWEYHSGDRSAFTIPTVRGWTANMAEIPYWEINFDDPESSEEVIHVVYVPDTPAKPSTPDSDGKGSQPKTGDESDAIAWIFILAAAIIAMISIKVYSSARKIK